MSLAVLWAPAASVATTIYVPRLNVSTSRVALVPSIMVPTLMRAPVSEYTSMIDAVPVVDLLVGFIGTRFYPCQAA